MASGVPDVGSAPVTGQRLFGRLVSDSALYGFSAAVAKALALLTVPYLTRALSPAGYGVSDLATSTAALLTLVAMFAGDIPTARAHGLAADGSMRRAILSSYAWATAGAGLAIAAVLAPLSGIIAGSVWGADDLASLALLTLLLVPISGFQAALVQVQRIRGRPGTFAVLSLVDLLAQLGLAVAFVAAGFGPVGVILGFLFGSVIGLAAAAFAARDVVQTRPSWTIAWRLTSRGIQYLPHVAVFVVADWALRSVLATGIGQESVAELGLAIRVASLLSLLGAAFAMAWGPIGLTRANDGATARLFGRVLVGYGALSVAAAIALGAIGPEVLAVLAGPGYEGAAVILPGFALAYAIAGTEYVLVVTAGVADRPRRVALAATIGAVVQVAVAVAVVPGLGTAAIGPVAVLGRMVSFAILLSGVRASINLPIGRIIGVAAVSVAAVALVQLAANQDAAWPILRWLTALALAAGVLFVAGRAFRQRRPMPA
jgi:O-antigen/teichoic acid export membrane protein